MHSDPRLKSSSISSLEWLLYMPHDFQVIRSLPSSFFRIECLKLKNEKLSSWLVRAREKFCVGENRCFFFFAMRKFPVRETNTKGTDILIASFYIKVAFLFLLKIVRCYSGEIILLQRFIALVFSETHP